MHHDKQKYILTLDVGNKVKLLRHTGLKTLEPADPFYTGFHDGLVNRIQDALPEVEVEVIHMESLAEKIISRASNECSSMSNAVIVSTCSEIAAPNRGHILEINRLVDSKGNILGLGPRPGHPPLDDQIDGIARLAKDQQIVLVENGAFSGKTLLYVINKFKERGVDLKAIVVGFVFPGSLDAVKKEFSGDVHVIEEASTPLDWMPDHDFVPFIPNCGRVLGVNMNGSNFPFYSYNGASYSFPYLRPFAPMTEWASIPEKDASKISDYCLRKTRDLFLTLEELNGRKIKVKDLAINPTRSKVSVPFKVSGSHFFDIFNENVGEFLWDVCKHAFLHVDESKY